jgi:hypothetical protein
LLNFNVIGLFVLKYLMQIPSGLMLAARFWMFSGFAGDLRHSRLYPGWFFLKVTA